MAKLNMANMNTLFRKGYLLAGVIMAANMLFVNEMKASAKEDNEENNDIKKDTDSQALIEDNTEENNVQTEQKVEIEKSNILAHANILDFFFNGKTLLTL